MQLMLAKSRELELKRTNASTYNCETPSFKHWQPHALRCAYFLAKNQLPYEVMPELCFLVKDSIDLFNGTSCFGRSVGAYGSYSNATSAADIVSVHILRDHVR
ncbi:hypothetical protein ACHHYP_20813 [Achlya hypogyna]|uniref:Uncharacterized protein n=1 Tax=Achlya hypogyna TaxID=1202772 RepID=A0A1V9Y946_ACHHY|nr:hypothetical protein ACHHYP_20813 [Achlya hypogyna]